MSGTLRAVFDASPDTPLWYEGSVVNKDDTPPPDAPCDWKKVSFHTVGAVKLVSE